MKESGTLLSIHLPDKFTTCLLEGRLSTVEDALIWSLCLFWTVSRSLSLNCWSLCCLVLATTGRLIKKAILLLLHACTEFCAAYLCFYDGLPLLLILWWFSSQDATSAVFSCCLLWWHSAALLKMLMMVLVRNKLLASSRWTPITWKKKLRVAYCC